MPQLASNRHKRMYELLQHHFKPLFIDLVDESYQHQVPKDAESHFKLTLVSQQFSGESRITRHQFVNDLVGQERKIGLHALSMALFSPEEWANQPQSLSTPPCHHKEKKI